MNKKGDVGDIGVFISVVFIIGITFWIGSVLWNNVLDPIQNKTQSMISDPVIETKLNESMDSISETFNMLDVIFAIFFFGFYIVLLISVFYLDTHPAFLVFALLGMLIMFVVAGVVGDVWSNIIGVGESSLSDGGLIEPNNFPIMDNILSNFLNYLIVMSGIFLIVLYASKKVTG